MNKRPQAIAKAIDQKKDKMLMAGLALLGGLMAAALFSTSAKASTITKNLSNLTGKTSGKTSGKKDLKMPFDLNSAKLSH